MNAVRLKLIAEIASKLSTAVGHIEQVKDEEQEDYDNLSEDAQDTTKGHAIQDNLESLDNAINTIEGVISDLESIE